MKNLGKLLVVCVDRDNDLGKKTGIKGPVWGREDNIKAATALALADPGETDANCIFGAVKKLEELKSEKIDAEIVTLTGVGKVGFKSDRELNEQLDDVMESYHADGFVLVTDGAEDDQIIPILQSRAKIISKETIVVKQAQEIESAYFTIKEFLRDPFVSRVVFGVPGIILLLYFVLGGISLQIISFVVGLYLVLKGFGIEEKIFEGIYGITESISVQRTSFPFYVGSLFILGFGAITGYNKFITTAIADPIIDTASIVQPTYIFVVLAALSVVIGRSIDLIHFKKAYLLKKYFLSIASIVLLWFILDAATLVLLRQADLSWFIGTIGVSFIILLFAFRVSQLIDIRKKVTKVLVGLPVYSKEGMMLGKVEAVNKKKSSITFTETKSSKSKELSKKEFRFGKGRIIAAA